MKQLLFYTRFLLYLAVVAIPFFHPAILVPYDLSGIGMWFVIVPGMFLIAFYLSPPLLKPGLWLGIAGGFLLIAALIFGGISLETLGLLGVGALAFILTVLVFKTQGKGRVVAAFEIFFTGALYIAFLSFSRSSQEIAQASSGVLKLLFTAAVLTFFLHAAVLFIASFPRTFQGRGRRNLLVLLGVLVPVAFVLAFLVPSDFIVHEVRLNPLGPELNPDLNPLDKDANAPLDGNLLDKLKRDKDGRLEGMNADRWKDMNLKQGRGPGQKQYAVMIVATDQKTLYLGSEFFGDLDPVKGLRKSLDEPLNDLADLRLIETWQNTTPVSDQKREEAQAHIFSSLNDRFFSYRPLSFTPTVLNKDIRPFVYGYEGHFDLSAATEADLAQGRNLTAVEKEELARYLGADLDSKTAAAFRAYLTPLLKPGMTGYQKVLAILNGFHTFQYELGFDERVDTAKILNFVLKSRTGDCTEFSNATAILARLAGLPTRVVTGYLASQDMMLPKHRRGLAYLQSQMPPLQKYDLSQLILVTNAHRHSWAEVFIAPYGWIDVEATAYAIPPPMSGDANQWNLVVPRMEKGTEGATAAPFTLLDLLKILGVGLIVLIGAGILIYVYKYLRLLVVAVAAQSNTRLGLRALQRLLLLRLADRGYAYKPPSVTISEYAEHNAGLADFAGHYTELRYRENFSDAERAAVWTGLRSEFARIMEEEKRKGRGPGRFLKRLFSLKGFRY